MTATIDSFDVIHDDGDERRYRHEIPNLVDDLGLSPYAYRLYGHYKRVCGAAGSVCKETTRKTAERTNMSTGKVSEAKHELREAGLIWWREYPTTHGPAHEIHISDIWVENATCYGHDRHLPWTTRVEQAKRSLAERMISQSEHKEEHDLGNTPYGVAQAALFAPDQGKGAFPLPPTKQRPKALSTRLVAAFEQAVTDRGWMPQMSKAQDVLRLLLDLDPQPNEQEVMDAVTDLIQSLPSPQAGKRGFVWFNKLPSMVKARRADQRQHAQERVMEPFDLDDVDTHGFLEQ